MDYVLKELIMLNDLIYLYNLNMYTHNPIMFMVSVLTLSSIAVATIFLLRFSINTVARHFTKSGKSVENSVHSQDNGVEVLQVVQHLRPGGLEAVALDLIQHANQGRVIHIVSLEGTKAELIKQWPKLRGFSSRIHALNKPQGVSFSCLLKLYQVINSIQPKVVHTHHIGPLLYGGIAARLARISTFIHTEHDAWFLNNPGLLRLEKFLLQHTKPILVADAQTVSKIIEERIPDANPMVIRNGIDTEKFCLGDKKESRKKLGLPQKVHLVGCAARLEPIKEHALLVNAFFNAFKDQKDVHLALAGQGSQEKNIRAQIAALGITDRVHMLGQVEKMPNFYQALDLFCLTSSAEGLPLSTLEAQSCGTPALVTDAGGMPETICPDSGQVVPVGDLWQLARAMSAMVNSKEIATPRKYVLNNGNVQRMSLTYDTLYVADNKKENSNGGEYVF
jgi:glycosyltransferase involved in cell wall biosynthesis